MPDAQQPEAPAATAAPARGERRIQRLAPRGQGGIAFAHDAPGGPGLDDDLDDDLAEYMHEEDVPEKA